MLLAGDIGGTNTRLALFASDDQRPKPMALEVFPSRAHAGLDEIVGKFLAAHPQRVERAAFGVAGPVKKNRVETSNLPWVVNGAQLAEQLRVKEVVLVNDLEANAHGLAALEPSDFVVLNEGKRDRGGNEALIAAGTGLGEAGLHWEGDYYQPFPSEGGHVDFAPRNELEVGLLLYLLKEFPHVSYERVLSGPGFHNIYRYLRDSGRYEEPNWLAEQIAQGDPVGGRDARGVGRPVRDRRASPEHFHFHLRRRSRQHDFEGYGHRRHLCRRRHRAQDD